MVLMHPLWNLKFGPLLAGYKRHIWVFKISSNVAMTKPMSISLMCLNYKLSVMVL